MICQRHDQPDVEQKADNPGGGGEGDARHPADVTAPGRTGKAARRHGEAKNSWLTGTAAWNFVALSQWIAGVRAEYAGLRIEPRLPAHVKNATITRVYRGCTYVITVENRDHAGKIALTVTSGGVKAEGTLVAAGAKGSTVEIKAIVG